MRLFVYSPDGTETSLMICGQPGEMFGELAVLDGLPRSATAVALCHTLLYSLSSQSFDQHMQECPRLALNFLNELSRRVRNSTRQMNYLASLGIPQRLAHTLLDLADNYGESEARGIRIGLSLTQDELASLVGATRESVNKILRDNRRQQWVQVQHKQIMILDLEALRAQVVG